MSRGRARAKQHVLTTYQVVLHVIQHGVEANCQGIGNRITTVFWLASRDFLHAALFEEYGAEECTASSRQEEPMLHQFQGS
jgi:hypothetical protein